MGKEVEKWGLGHVVPRKSLIQEQDELGEPVEGLEEEAEKLPQELHS